MPLSSTCRNQSLFSLLSTLLLAALTLAATAGHLYLQAHPHAQSLEWFGAFHSFELALFPIPAATFLVALDLLRKRRLRPLAITGLCVASADILFHAFLAFSAYAFPNDFMLLSYKLHYLLPELDTNFMLIAILLRPRLTHLGRWLQRAVAIAILLFLANRLLAFLPTPLYLQFPLGIRQSLSWISLVAAITAFLLLPFVAYFILFSRAAPPHSAPTGTSLTTILTCPRCNTLQTLPLAGASCPTCRLHIALTLTDPLCPTCAYPQRNLPPNTPCPECGTLAETSLITEWL
jgi:hypothetical protein